MTDPTTDSGSATSSPAASGAGTIKVTGLAAATATAERINRIIAKAQETSKLNASLTASTSVMMMPFAKAAEAALANTTSLSHALASLDTAATLTASLAAANGPLATLGAAQADLMKDFSRSATITAAMASTDSISRIIAKAQETSKLNASLTASTSAMMMPFAKAAEAALANTTSLSHALASLDTMAGLRETMVRAGARWSEFYPAPPPGFTPGLTRIAGLGVGARPDVAGVPAEHAVGNHSEELLGDSPGALAPAKVVPNIVFAIVVSFLAAWWLSELNRLGHDIRQVNRVELLLTVFGMITVACWIRSLLIRMLPDE